MSDPTAAEPEAPATQELDETSTEKEPTEAPKAPAPDDPEVDHQAVGLGVVNGEGNSD